jgi:hypothetical protein
MSDVKADGTSKPCKEPLRLNQMIGGVLVTMSAHLALKLR